MRSQSRWDPWGVVSSLEGSRDKGSEALAFFNYLKPENALFLTALYQASTPKLVNCHFEWYHEGSTIGGEILLFWKWINLPR